MTQKLYYENQYIKDFYIKYHGFTLFSRRKIINIHIKALATDSGKLYIICRTKLNISRR